MGAILQRDLHTRYYLTGNMQTMAGIPMTTSNRSHDINCSMIIMAAYSNYPNVF